MTAPDRDEGAAPGTTRPDHPPAPRAPWITTLALLALAVLAAGSWIDDAARAHYDDAFKRALVTFALARSLNGVISVIQGTEVAVEPAGVGVNFAPGQIVDPINDLIERFSWVMLASTTSLGIQQVFMEMSAWSGVRAVTAGAALLAVLLLWLCRRGGPGPDGSNQGLSPATARRWALRLVLFAAFLRLAVPLALLLNHGAYVLFLESDYEASAQVVEQTSERLSDLNAQAREPTEAGWMERARGWIDDRTEALDWRARLDEYQAQLAAATEHLLRLTAVFVLQTILLPLLFLWLLAQAWRGLASGLRPRG